jgi:hypothetical protein
MVLSPSPDLFPLPVGERVRVREARIQCVKDALNNAAHVAEHFVVPETQDEIAMRF